MKYYFVIFVEMLPEIPIKRHFIECKFMTICRMRFFMPSSLFVLSILFGHKFQYFQIKSSYLQAIITMVGKIAISCKRKRKDKETVKEVKDVTYKWSRIFQWLSLRRCPLKLKESRKPAQKVSNRHCELQEESIIFFKAFVISVANWPLSKNKFRPVIWLESSYI